MSRDIEKVNDAVAIKVMGYTRGTRQSLHAAEGGTFWDGSCLHKWEDDIGPTATYWSPSTDPAAAMQVVERMRELGFSWRGHHDASGCVYFAFHKGRRVYGADGRSVLECINAAALRAVAGDEGGGE